jgi:hypothetical protein
LQSGCEANAQRGATRHIVSNHPNCPEFWREEGRLKTQNNAELRPGTPENDDIDRMILMARSNPHGQLFEYEFVFTLIERITSRAFGQLCDIVT